MALEMTYGILVLEVIHCIIVCFFEVNVYRMHAMNIESGMEMIAKHFS